MLLYKKHLFKEELTAFLEQYNKIKNFLISIRKYQQKSILMEVKK